MLLNYRQSGINAQGSCCIAGCSKTCAQANEMTVSGGHPQRVHFKGWACVCGVHYCQCLNAGCLIFEGHSVGGKSVIELEKHKISNSAMWKHLSSRVTLSVYLTLYSADYTCIDAFCLINGRQRVFLDHFTWTILWMNSNVQKGQKHIATHCVTDWK